MDKHFLDLDELIEKYPNVTLFDLVGLRGVGKTYGAKKYALEQFFKHGKKFVYVRRMEKEVTAGMIRDVFEDVLTNEQYKFTHGYAIYRILPRNRRFWLCGMDEIGGKINYIQEIGTYTTLTDGENFKGGVYYDYSCIIFDEVISRTGYKKGPKEPELFDDIVNTVARSHNPDLKVFLCGNPAYSIESCPYFTRLRLDYSKMQPNIPYIYDTVVRDDQGHIVKTIANNELFIKLTGDGSQYLNDNASTLFDTAVERMSESGEAMVDIFPQWAAAWDDMYSPIAELKIETDVITNNIYHVCLWAYVGYINLVPVVRISPHRMYQDRALIKVFCRTDDKTLVLPDPDTYLGYKMQLPNVQGMQPVKAAIANALLTKCVVGDNRSVSLFMDICNNG